MHITPVYFHMDSIVQEFLLLPAYFPPCHSARIRKAKLQNPLFQLMKENHLPGEKVPARADEDCQKVLFPGPHPLPATVPPLPKVEG